MKQVKAVSNVVRESRDARETDDAERDDGQAGKDARARSAQELL
jgi:hypothetical protein